MKKGIEPLLFTMQYYKDNLLITYYTDGPITNHLHSVLLNNTYPIDTIELVTEPQFLELKEQIFAAVSNNSHSYWEQENEIFN